MFSELTEMLTKIDDFIDNYDDDEAVQLVSSLYLMVTSLAGELNKLTIENRLLEREVKLLSEEEDDPIANFLDKQEKLVS